MERDLLLRDVEVDGVRSDVLVGRGRVRAIVPTGSRDRALRSAETLVDGGGGALLPGLVDHHLHVLALAAQRDSVDCRSGLHGLADALGDRDGWVRGTGDPTDGLTAARLDRVVAGRPVRVQHRSGAAWTLNSAGLSAIGSLDHPGVERKPDGTPTGRILRADAWLRSRLPPSGPPDPAGVGRELARAGITAVTDATPDLEPAAADALATLPQRLTLLGTPLGIRPPPGVSSGPYKIVLADSGLPALDRLVEVVRAAHADDRGVAVHCVTQESLVLLLVALDEAGRHPADRVEHAALVPAELVSRLAGLAVVTQPGFVADRGHDYRRTVPADDLPDLYRARSLLAAGVGLALSSDAPYGPLDPWQVVAAATNRRTPDGEQLESGETLTPRQALDAYLATVPGGPPRRVRVRAPADLVVLQRPLEQVLRDPAATRVRTTLISGLPVG